MARRKHSFVEGKFYHIYAHSIGDSSLFKSKVDYERFLGVLFTANGEKDIPRLDRFQALSKVWGTRDGGKDIGEPLVDIVCFCIMPNHFHLLLRERKDGNISIFMHRILVSYAKYFNLKYQRRGHVFENKFNSKLLADNKYLLRASSYIHLNPKDVRGFNKKEYLYNWSSFQDYIAESRWGRLLDRKIIMSQFSNRGEYKRFVNSARSEKYDLDADTD